MKRVHPAILALSLIASVHYVSPAQVGQDDAIRIGAIDYFGYAGLDLELVKQKNPFKVGGEFRYTALDSEREAIQHAVKEATGRPATDIAAVCCDANRHLLIYIGLSGTSSQPLRLNPTPSGDDHLEDSALKLYEGFDEAIQNAVRRGVSGEDDSTGYSLSIDPEARKEQLAMRAYALTHKQLLEQVLENSASAEQRRVSAQILGYADRSADQIQHLSHAVIDTDAEVRNNAIRALEVLASAKNASGIEVDPRPFIDLLYSGRWTDRNKSSMLLMRLTKSRNPALLETLRNNAMAPLAEGAAWSNPGHSTAFLAILGRVEGTPEDKLWKAIASGDKQQIIQMAGQEATVK